MPDLPDLPDLPELTEAVKTGNRVKAADLTAATIEVLRGAELEQSAGAVRQHQRRGHGASIPRRDRTRGPFQARRRHDPARRRSLQRPLRAPSVSWDINRFIIELIVGLLDCYGNEA